ncbi:hypothetical protein [Baekduia soli]|nr:hypothetical protein [Baekduia soli]
MLPALLLCVLVAAAVLLGRRGPGRRVQVRSCCSLQTWPPDDLTDPVPPA